MTLDESLVMGAEEGGASVVMLAAMTTTLTQWNMAWNTLKDTDMHSVGVGDGGLVDGGWGGVGGMQRERDGQVIAARR